MGLVISSFTNSIPSDSESDIAATDMIKRQKKRNKLTDSWLDRIRNQLTERPFVERRWGILNKSSGAWKRERDKIRGPNAKNNYLVAPQAGKRYKKKKREKEENHNWWGNERRVITVGNGASVEKSKPLPTTAKFLIRFCCITLSSFLSMLAVSSNAMKV